MRTKKIKRKNIRKNMINIAVLFLIILTSTTFKIYSLGQKNKASQESYSYYTIMSGDTLWDISTKYKNPKDDPRDFIEKIVELNQLTSLNIVPGQRLLIPTY